MKKEQKGGTIDLLVENYKAIKKLHVVLVAGCNEIGGPNGAGKSSALNSVSNLFGGKKLTPPEPVHEGADGYRLEAKLTEIGLCLTRTGILDEDGKLKEEFIVTPLEGEGAGRGLGRPKELIDKLLGHHSMTLKPLVEMANADRIALLQRCAGLDFSEADEKRATLYKERTGVNSETESLKSRVEGMSQYPDAPKTLVSISALVAEKDKLQETNLANDQARRDLEDDNGRLEVEIAHHAYLVNAEAEARATVEVAQKAAEVANQKTEEAQEMLNANREANKALRSNIAKLEDIDLSPISRQIDGAEAVNDEVKANADRADVSIAYTASKDRGTLLSGEIRKIDEWKKAQLADAKIPGGLSWEEGVVRMNGKPLEQASQVEQMDADIAVAIAQNPKVPIILIDKGSLYDKVHRGKLDKVAKKHGVFVFFELVIDTKEDAAREGVAVFMQDGVGINLDEVADADSK